MKLMTIIFRCPNLWSNNEFKHLNFLQHFFFMWKMLSIISWCLIKSYVVLANYNSLKINNDVNPVISRVSNNYDMTYDINYDINNKIIVSSRLASFFVSYLGMFHIFFLNFFFTYCYTSEINRKDRFN